MSRKEETFKISLSLIDNVELQRIDTYYNEIADEFLKQYVKEKDMVVAQRVMMNLRKENQKYEEVIDKAIEYINGAYEMAIYTKSISLDEENIEDLLEILKEVKK